MNVLVPLGLALGVTLPIVVVFYLLKVRRHDEEVSSTFLWNDLLRDLAAHEPLQKLKWNVLLALQLLLLGLLTFALARPFVEQIGERPVHAVLLLDASASMRATDVQPSRFARAQQDALRTLASLPESSVATVILAGTHPQVLVAAAEDRRRVERAIQEAQPSGAAGNIREALLLARSLGGDPGSRRIHLFSDLAFTPPGDLPEDLGTVVVSQAAEPNASNLAVTAISARPDPADNRRRHLFARVENLGPNPTAGTLRLSVDGQLIDERALQLAASASAEQVFEDLPIGARTASVTIDGAESTFTFDDAAFSVLGQRRPAQVLLVSPGNPFLEKVLSLLPNTELYRIPARRYLGAEADRFDIIVFDDYLPPLLPRGNLLVVNPPERSAVRTTGEMRRPRVGSWERDDPLMAFVDIRDLAVNRAKRLDLPRWAKPLITTPDGLALLAAGQDGDRRMAIVPFDLRQSNLPLSPAFPILMSNIFSYLAPVGVVQGAEIRTGEVETLAPLPQVEMVRVLPPDERSQDLKSGSGPLSFAGTDVPGLYRVQQFLAGGAQTVDEDVFAVNLADRDESDIRPRAMGLAGTTTVERSVAPLQRELWWLLAALGLSLLLFEWFWFHRRT